MFLSFDSSQGKISIMKPVRRSMFWQTGANQRKANQVRASCLGLLNFIKTHVKGEGSAKLEDFLEALNLASCCVLQSILCLPFLIFLSSNCCLSRKSSASITFSYIFQCLASPGSALSRLLSRVHTSRFLQQLSKQVLDPYCLPIASFHSNE